MQTRALFYESPFLTTCEAEVLEVITAGPRPQVVLNQTLFYPEGGGQPWDLGSVGEAKVVGVTKENGVIFHEVEGPVPSGKVVLKLDWVRRFDHMQQHTGQHLLSAILHEEYHAPTVGFHLGTAACTVDLEGGPFEATVFEAVEGLVNDIIWEGRPVRATWPDEATLAGMKLRKETEIEGPKRVVEIEGIDFSLCAGTHVNSTAQLGLLKIRKWEKNKGNTTRVEFLVGKRAFQDYSWKHQALAAAARLLEGQDKDVEPGVVRLKEQVRSLSKQRQELREEVLGYRAAGVVENAEVRNGSKVILSLVDDLTPQEVRYYALKCVAFPGVITGMVQCGEGRVTLVLARSADGTFNCGEAVGAVCMEFGGKGGGKPDLAQGGGPGGKAEAEKYLEKLRELVGS